MFKGIFFKALFTLLVIQLIMACNAPSNLKTGDILFRGKQNGSLSSAIDAVTQTGLDHHYTHVGVVEMLDGEVMVWHAAPKKGVVCETLAQFVDSEKMDSLVVGQYRAKTITQTSIVEALKKAKELEGQAYDYTYILESEGYYCSEFVYELFAQDSLFKMEPMTFINPATDSFHEAWLTHYEDLGLDIPEGLPGCNPNGMAASDQLDFIGYLKL
ncbi:YiiX/YebB-like N1pC/P60 family cysteine hydrolase [Carboxylicivirga sp. N1Y90]|uniref:YiiX/YebB-like N1pC/P60 family cysteine hydrolase n=1 Tax=Carboxylicivirga fragile TaxID=3417571 RepID=UPI003D324A9E|nr:hypothetical protein [Marinilabiliaceae bacterium N1Y90]